MNKEYDLQRVSNIGQNKMTFPVKVKLTEEKIKHGKIETFFEGVFSVYYRDLNKTEDEVLYRLFKDVLAREVEDNLDKVCQQNGLMFLKEFNKTIKAVAQKRGQDVNLEVGSVILDKAVIRQQKMKSLDLGITTLTLSQTASKKRVNTPLDKTL